ncbi:M23 family metallopeptidase [Streptomyces endophyticus]|uniref:M23 family metallopeptidase n=1 Tax=Streptomyces endophyticus TaxID=714166 RepID=A0ABU6EYB8_9ACTN|nr:M23 family metallopeptidase [Streptomyces endophyticus]MEB8336725.1 M23 family metallopeptidase [Streptomyces endophyticus]
MNDRNPSGPAPYAAYDGYSATSFASDPLFGDMAEDPYEPGSHATGQWNTAPQQQYADPYASAYYDTGTYDAAAFGTGSYDTGAYDTTGTWATGGYEQVADIPAQQPRTMTEQHATGQWDTSAYEAQMYAAQHPDTQSFEAPPFGTQAFDTQSFETQSFETQSFEFQGFEAQHFEAQGFETQSFSTHDMLGAPDPHDTQGFTHTFQAPVFGTTAYDTGAYDATQWNAADAVDTAEHGTGTGIAAEPEPEPVAEPAPEADHAHGPVLDSATEPAPAAPQPTSRRAGKNVSRGRAGRRRPPAKRSALITVVVPSVCVVGVAGIAAASVGGGGEDDGKETQAAAASDAQAVKPAVANNKLDSQLKDLSADAGDFADRASRTQERIDLKAKQEAARKQAAEEAARKEAARPKFVLPVKQHGLSAFFGQAGVNWMSQHSGIDFPVSYGTPVMAATDGTVKTQWNSAYGNMAIVTAKDGTETWYCHLSSHTVMSGPVKAGDVIARSGNSGNSTGPHLHFEVRPGGSAAIDPLPWLRSHGINPN